MTNFYCGYTRMPDGKKIPIIWNGQYAEHLALNHFTGTKNLYPLLHQDVQRLLHKYRLSEKEGGSYLCLAPAPGGGWYFIPVIKKPLGIIPKTCIFEGHQTRDTAEKQHKVIRGTSSRKKTSLKVHNIELSPDVINALEQEGISEATAKKAIIKFQKSKKRK